MDPAKIQAALKAAQDAASHYQNVAVSQQVKVATEAATHGRPMSARPMSNLPRPPSQPMYQNSSMAAMDTAERGPASTAPAESMQHSITDIQVGPSNSCVAPLALASSASPHSAAPMLGLPRRANYAI